MADMPNNTVAIFEVFEAVEKAKTKADKIKALHAHSSPVLKDFLSYTFDKNIQWLVPEGAPPYKPSEDDTNLLRGRLRQEFRILKHFLNIAPNPNMNVRKRESLFIDVLGTIHPKDAELLLYVKDKRSLPHKGVTLKLIAEAFPLLVAKWKTD